jgi:hypothetical protein
MSIGIEFMSLRNSTSRALVPEIMPAEVRNPGAASPSQIVWPGKAACWAIFRNGA